VDADGYGSMRYNKLILNYLIAPICSTTTK